MTPRTLRVGEDVFSLLTEHPSLARLLGLMAGWWSGKSCGQLAREQGLSRTRVHALLKSVGCTSRQPRSAARYPDSPRRASPWAQRNALDCLTHASARKLTAKQREALCWRAQGLIYGDIAKRMGTTAQGACNFIAAAEKRLSRIEGATWPIDTQLDLDAIDTSELERMLEQSAAVEPERAFRAQERCA